MSLWQANLAALRRRHDGGSRRLAAALDERGPAPDEGLRTRDGRPLPGRRHDGRALALVSSFDAAQQARRWAESPQRGAVVVWGLAGHAALTALREQGATVVFWLEPSLELWRSVFTFEDWSAEADTDDWLAVTGTPQDWEVTLKERYHPEWDGGLRTLEWRAAVVGREVEGEGFRRATQAALDQIAADASTQARFAERWYRNSLVNLRRLQPADIAVPRGVKVVVAGAGPSLDDALEAPMNRRWLEGRGSTGDLLFATDTALPALTARGVVPDLVLCLDGQLATYHHFVPAPPTAPVVADLASLPLLGRLGVPVVRYLSGHPLGAVVKRWFPDLPVLDGSLGNVSGLAWRTAQSLGASELTAWGVDFGYRDGQAYAHGTYVYDLAQRRANRLSPLESRLAASCYGAAGRERTRDSQGRALDTTPLLRDYRRRWEDQREAQAAVRLRHGGNQPWQRFSADWSERLASLPLPKSGQSMHALVRGLAADRQQDWFALWPLALALHRQGVPTGELALTVRTKAQSFLQD